MTRKPLTLAVVVLNVAFGANFSVIMTSQYNVKSNALCAMTSIFARCHATSIHKSSVLTGRANENCLNNKQRSFHQYMAWVFMQLYVMKWIRLNIIISLSPLTFFYGHQQLFFYFYSIYTFSLIHVDGTGFDWVLHVQ